MIDKSNYLVQVRQRPMDEWMAASSFVKDEFSIGLFHWPNDMIIQTLYKKIKPYRFTATAAVVNALWSKTLTL